MAVELASAYVSLSVNTSKIPKQIDSALNGAGSRSADRAGASIGEKLSSAMGTAVKAGAAAAGAAAAGFIGTALTKGFQRLTAIDDAQAKLEGLGHSTAGTAKIMESALAAVRGTSYGLGEAATISASAVAAGVKPGQELTKYLSLTADAATIAGTSLEEMGAIINKVKTKGKAYTLDLNQLAIRGVPIYQWLAEEMGVTQEALSDMVAEGKVDSATYLKVIEQNIGGAAVAGNAVSAAWANTMAAMGRLGEAALKPTFGRTANWLKGAIVAIDGLTDRVKPLAVALDAKVFDEWAPKIAAGMSGLGEAFDELRSSESVQRNMDRMGAVLDSLIETGSALWPVVKSIGESLLEASAATGISSWQVLVTALEAAAGIADAVLVPALSALSSLMESNQGAVTGLALAFLAFKTIPNLIKPIAAAAQGVRTAYVNTITPVRGFADQMRLQQSLAASSGQSVGRFGAALSVAGVHAQTAAGRLKTFGQNAMNAVGGGVGLAIGAATTALVMNASSASSAESAQRALSEAVVEGAKAQAGFFSAIAATNGALDDQATEAASKSVESALSWITELGERGHTSMENLGHLIDNMTGNVFGANDAWEENYDRVTAAVESNDALRGVLEDMKLDMSDLGRVVAEGGREYDTLRSNLEDLGEPGQRVVDILEDQARQFDSSREALQLMGPEASGIAAAFDILADSASKADDKLSAMKRTLQELGILETDVEAAAFELAEEVTKAAERAAKPLEEGTATGADLLNEDGSLNSQAKGASDLRAELLSLGDAYLHARNSGMDAGEAWESVAPTLDALRERYKLSVEQFEVLTERAGLVPEVVTTLLALEGADETREAMLNVALQLENLPAAKIQVDPEDDSAREYLESLGLTVRTLDAEKGIIEVTADTDEAQARLDQARRTAEQYGAVEAEAKIDLDTTYFDLKADETSALLDFLNEQTPSPEADLIIDKLEEGKRVSVEELIALSGETADPKAYLQGVQDLLADAQRISDALDRATEERRAQIIIDWSNAYSGARAANPGFVGPLATAPTFRAAGGPIFGPGGPTSDSIPAMLSAGEHVLTASEVDAAGGQGAVYKMRAAIRAGALRFNQGGAVSDGIQAALQAGRSVTGNKYVWGGTGPTGFDCSGFVGWLQQIAMGLSAAAAAGKRLYTTHDFFGQGSNGYAGLLPGLGPAGTQFQVGVSREHMSATIGGQPAESGGSHGTSRIGSPAVGATDSQYTKWFHLPNEKVAGELAAYAQRSGGRRRRQEEQPEWTESDQLDLDSAHLSVLEARESRNKMNKDDSKATDIDKQQADIAIRRAELRVIELQKKKDEAANWVPEGPAPEAPSLAEAYEKEERERLRAQIALDDARLDRNEVYADPFATDNERLEADLAVMDAQERLDEIMEGKGDKSGKEKLDYSLRGSLTRFGYGVVDAAMAGIFGQLPNEIGSSRWVTTDWASLIPDEVDGEGSGWLFDPDDPIGRVPAPSKDKVDRQLPVTPGAPGWLDGLLKVDDFAEKLPQSELERLRKKAPKVYDSGGWLMPGESAINLSDRPEPIFNSPDQLRRFAGQLEPAEQVQPVDNSIHFNRDVQVADFEGFKRELRWEQDRQSRPYRRR